MTVCIGTLCSTLENKCDTVIVASDRMVTLGGFMEFEHDSPKITKMTPNCMVLIAGDALRGSKLVEELKSKVVDTDDIKKIVQEASLAYVTCRDKQIDSDIFRPRGFTKADFYSNYQQRLLPQITVQLDQLTHQFNFNVEMLIAGVDDSGGHIYSIVNPGGSPIHFNQLGYHAIGSGAIHAMQSLIGFKHSDGKKVENTLFYTYASKRRGEVAPGVGKETDIYIIKHNNIVKVSEQDLGKLEEIYSIYSHPIEETAFEEVKKISIFTPHATTEITTTAGVN
jgi:20S proteasome alpha/beta subunit